MRVDLEDLVERINDDVAAARAELEEIREEARATDDPDEYDELEEEAAEAEDVIAGLESDREDVRDRMDEWGDTAFEIGDLTWGDRNAIDDEVRAQAVKRNMDDTTALIGAYKLAFVNHAVVRTPPGAPSKAAEYPAAIGDWLYDRADEYNTGGGEIDAKNSSPLGEIERPGGPRSSSGTE